MMNIILIAPPAAGKGTESKMIETDYSIPHISTGDLLRTAGSKNDELGKEITKLISTGAFVSDQIILKLIENRIANDDCKRGYILDGFPRDIAQAQEYDKILEKQKKEISYVFVIDIDKEIAKSRILSRRICENCGRVYNLNSKALSPRKLGICDDCKTTLIKREDDNAITYEKRYNSYLEKTAPLIEYYDKKGVLYHINGNVDKDYTHDQIKEILREKND